MVQQQTWPPSSDQDWVGGAISQAAGPTREGTSGGIWPALKPIIESINKRLAAIEQRIGLKPDVLLDLQAMENEGGGDQVGPRLVPDTHTGQVPPLTVSGGVPPIRFVTKPWGRAPGLLPGIPTC